MPLHSLRRRQRGATSVELALIAPVFFMMMMGVMEIGLMTYTQHLLENATFNASRTGKTGYVNTGLATPTQMGTVMAVLNNRLSSMSPLIDPAKVTITTTAYNSLGALQTNTGGTAGLGTAQQVVVYTITYPWKPFTPLIGTLVGDTTGTVKLSSRIVVQNEPY